MLDIKYSGVIADTKWYMFTQRTSDKVEYAGNFEIDGKDIDVSSVYLAVTDNTFKDKVKDKIYKIVLENFKEIDSLEVNSQITIK